MFSRHDPPPPPLGELGDGTPISLAEVLPLAPAQDYPGLTEDVKAKLILAWGDLPAARLGANNVFVVIHNLLGILTDQDGYTDQQRQEVAQQLLSMLRSMELSIAGNALIPDPLPAQPGVPVSADVRKPAPPARVVSEPDDLTPIIERLTSVSMGQFIVGGVGKSFGPAVCGELDLVGFNIRVSNVIVLDRLSVSGAGISGTIFVPPGTRVTSGIHLHLQVIELDWPDLAVQAGL